MIKLIWPGFMCVVEVISQYHLTLKTIVVESVDKMSIGFLGRL